MADTRQPSSLTETEALIELRFIARADRLKLVRAGVRAAARMCGFDDSTAQNIVLAVDENVIVHGYKNSADGTVILGLFRCRDGILVRLRDYAPRIDPSKVKPRDLRDVRPGKLGTHFIREIMDTVEFRAAPEGNGNLLEMTKQAGSSQ